jgi:hypothetical protein
MSKKEGSKKTQFKKGQTGNPNGRPTLPKEIRDIKKFSAKELEELITVLFRADDIEIQAILNDPTAPRIKKIMAQVLDKAMETGNMSQVDMVFNRVVGKVKEKVELLGKPSILVTTDGKQFKFAHGKNEDEE